jgi:hypothetical protein
MSIIEKTLKLERLHKLIEQKYWGNAEDYVKKLNISRSCLFNYIEELKKAGAEIEYCRYSNSFVYLNEFVFEIRIKSEVICKKEMYKIFGGINNFLFSVHFFRRKKDTFAYEKYN